MTDGVTEIRLAQQKEFLEKLDALQKEYGFIICGCGCCGSPWIQDEEYILPDIENY